MRWKIWYGDGRTFSDADGTPAQAPAVNVQAIAQPDPKIGRFISTRSDFYLYRDGKWWPVDWFGLLDHLMDMGIVKAGRTIENESYDRIIQQALHDPNFPRKSAKSKREKFSWGNST